MARPRKPRRPPPPYRVIFELDGREVTAAEFLAARIKDPVVAAGVRELLRGLLGPPTPAPAPPPPPSRVPEPRRSAASPPAETPPRYMRARHIRARYGISDVTIWRWVKAGKIPPPVRLGNTAARFWDREDLLAWEAVAAHEVAPDPEDPEP